MLAARHMSESGIQDYQLAKRKAAQKLGMDETRNLPSNKEIEAALIEYQDLFHADSQPQLLSQLRETAVHAMEFLQAFKPRLAGDVLSGTANEYTPVEIHVFADYPEQVSLYLMEQHIPYNEKQKRVKYDNDYEQQPVFSITADNIEVDIIVFSVEKLRRPPDSPIDGKPMNRIDLKSVQALLQAG